MLFGAGGASAESATINNTGGRVIFQETSTGGSATINNNGGVVQVSNTATLAGATVVNENDTINGRTGQVYINGMTPGTNAAIGSLSGSGNVVLGDATLEVGALGQNDIISGVIAGTGPGVQDKNGANYVNSVLLGTGTVVKVGAGTLTLTGDNTYTGGTTISGGALQLGNGTASGSVVGAITNNASLIVNRSDNYTLANAITGTGTLTQAGAGTTTVTGANNYSGGTILNAGG